MCQHNQPCRACQQDPQLQGFGSADGFSLAQALTDPDAVIQKYKEDAYKIVLAFAGALVVGNYLMMHQVFNQKIKKVRRS